MDEDSGGLSALDYINIIYIRYFHQLCQNTEGEKSTIDEISESDSSEIGEPDFGDIDRDVEHQKAGDYNRRLVSELTLEKQPVFSGILAEGVLNNQLKEAAPSSYLLQEDYQNKHCDGEQHYIPIAGSNKDYCDTYCNHSVQHYPCEVDGDLTLGNDYGVNSIYRNNTDQDSDFATEVDYMDFTDYIRLTKSCDFIDTSDSEYFLEEYHMIRRHSSPGYFYYLACDKKEVAHDTTGMSDLCLDNYYELQDTLGAVGYQNNHVEDTLAGNYLSETSEQIKPSFSDEENLETYFKDFSIIFRNDSHVSAFRSTISAKYNNEVDINDPLKVSEVQFEPAEVSQGKSENGEERRTELASDDSPISTLSVNLRNRKKKAKLKKKREKMVLIEKTEPGRKPKKSKFAETLEELFREHKEETEIDDALACPVCWEVFYNPYICRPCGHVFCEPCLRKISRIYRAEKRDSPCPICREPIQYCVVDYELGLHVRNFLPDEHNQRRLQDGRGKHMSVPLPSKPNPLSVAGILRRNRRHRQRFTMNPIRLDFWRFLVLIILFLSFKASLLVIVLFLFNITNSYLTGEKMHTFGSLFNSAGFWGCAFLAGCIILLLTTRQIFKWIRLKLQF